MKRRPWTTKQIAFLKRHYYSLSQAELAAILGRTKGAVSMQAQYLGVRRFEKKPIDRERLRALHALGMCDTEIAKKMRACRISIAGHRRAMGLPSNAKSQRQKDRKLKVYRKWCRDNHVSSMVEVRHQRARADAMRSGWPADCCGLAHRILEQLEAGPKTAAQMVAGLGWKSRRGLIYTGGRRVGVVTWLIERGYVFRVGDKIATKPGGNRNAYLYGLAIKRRHIGNPFTLDRFNSASDEDAPNLRVGA